MFCKTMTALVIALALGSSALCTSAFARGGGGLGGGHVARGGYGGYGGRVNSLHGGSNGYGRGDVWGHWGAYYGPMIP
jgi:hypothetical protein